MLWDFLAVQSSLAWLPRNWFSSYFWIWEKRGQLAVVYIKVVFSFIIALLPECKHLNACRPWTWLTLFMVHCCCSRRWLRWLSCILNPIVLDLCVGLRSLLLSWTSTLVLTAVCWGYVACSTPRQAFTVVLSFIVTVLSSSSLLIYLFCIQSTVSSSSPPPNPSAYLSLSPAPICSSSVCTGAVLESGSCPDEGSSPFCPQKRTTDVLWSEEEILYADSFC